MASKALAGAATAVMRDRVIRADAMMVFMDVLQRVWEPTSSAFHLVDSELSQQIRDVTPS